MKSDNAPTPLLKILTTLGILPIVFGAIFMLTQYDFVYNVSGDHGLILGGFILVTYSAVILSFIGGAHYGFAIQLSPEKHQDLIVWSNIVALLSWTVLLVPLGLVMIAAWCPGINAAEFYQMTVSVSFGLIILTFIAQLLVDKKLLERKLIQSWYFRMRMAITTPTVIIFAILLIYSQRHTI